MSAVTDLFRRASSLSEEERAALAGLLIESLESEHDEGVDQAWAGETERRLAELDSGIETVPWETVRARLFRRPDGS
jgi:putative addiction module component (TIGR02574 family)